MRREAVRNGLREIEGGLFLQIGCANERCGMCGVLKAVGHDDSDGLAMIVHLIVLKRLKRAAYLGVHQRLGLIWKDNFVRIAMRDHGEHAGSLLCRSGIDLGNLPLSNGAQNEHAVGHILDLEFSGVSSATRHLEPAIHATHWRPDRLLHIGHFTSPCRMHLQFAGCAYSIFPALVRARTMTRFASSILNALCFCALAPSSAAFAAVTYASSPGLFPTSAFSASAERHGFVAPPPSATRAALLYPSL